MLYNTILPCYGPCYRPRGPRRWPMGESSRRAADLLFVGIPAVNGLADALQWHCMYPAMHKKEVLCCYWRVSIPLPWSRHTWLTAVPIAGQYTKYSIEEHMLVFSCSSVSCCCCCCCCCSYSVIGLLCDVIHFLSVFLIVSIGLLNNIFIQTLRAFCRTGFRNRRLRVKTFVT